MKIIVIGLGNFGMPLAINLSDTDNEVIAVDKDFEKIELIKDKVAHAVKLDATVENAYNSLPLNNTDLVIVSMGSNSGESIIVTALIKKLTDAKIITRSSSDIEDNIFEAMGVDEIVHPEKEYAIRYTKRINLKGSVDNFEIDDNYLISEVAVKEKHIGQTLGEINYRSMYNLNVITILRKQRSKGFLGRTRIKKRVIGIPTPEIVFHKDDILVVFGNDAAIKKYLNFNE